MLALSFLSLTQTGICSTVYRALSSARAGIWQPESAQTVSSNLTWSFHDLIESRAFSAALIAHTFPACRARADNAESFLYDT
jgi:hypothetical protein